jgi:glycosyltransferase involved in cell wall biosynthesis
MLNNYQRGRILMVLENAFPIQGGGGGAERQVRTLSKHFASIGFNVQIVVPMVSYGPQNHTDIVDGARVYRIAYPKIKILGGVLMLLKLAAYLIKNRGSYDIIHVHIAHHMAAVCCVISRFLRKPVIVKLTGWLEMKHGVLAKHRHAPTIKILRWALRKANYYQATSKQIVNLLRSFGFDNRKIYCIPNAVDITRFSRTGDAQHPLLKLSESASLVGLYVGRLIPEKGLELLINAWSRAFSVEDDVHLLIVGDGELRAHLEALVRNHQRDHQIIFCGISDHVESYLRIADFGILASVYEGLSNALLEYMAASLPVLGSRISGTEDVVLENETGWLFTSGDQSELVACLKYVKQMNKEELRIIGAKARRWVSDYAGIESISARLLELYGLDIQWPKSPAIGES